MLAGNRHLTARRDTDVDRAVERVLGPIVDAVERCMGRDLRSLALIGSFGRGEGGVRLEKGKITIVNDLDFVVVPRGLGFWGWHRHASALAAEAEVLAEYLEIKQIDIGFRTVAMLRRPPLTVADYEIAAGHMVLSGSPLPVDLGRFEEGHAIPLKEGTVYFLNRGSGLLLARRYLSSGGALRNHDAENFAIEIDKAVLAMGDAFLIERRLYTASYRERSNRMAGLDLTTLTDGAWIQSRYLAAVERKLFPGRRSVKADPMGLWEEVQQVFLRFFLGYENRRIGRSFENWLEYSGAIGQRWRSGRRHALGRGLRSLVEGGVVGGILSPARWREAARRQPRRLLQIMPLLLCAVEPNRVRVEELEQAEQLLGHATDGRHQDRWDGAVNRYLLLYHPTGAAGKIARRPAAGLVPG